MNNNIQQILPYHMETSVTYTSKKLGTYFQIIGLTKSQNKQALIYHSKCLHPSCNKDYLGETIKIIIEGTTYHCWKQTNY